MKKIFVGGDCWSVIFEAPYPNKAPRTDEDVKYAFPVVGADVLIGPRAVPAARYGVPMKPRNVRSRL